MRSAAVIGSVALGILAAKLAVVSAYGTSVPFFDAWEAEGLQVYLRLIAGDLRASDLVVPHNEHRIGIQRLIGLGLFVANGQWDARLQMVVNAALHTLAAVVLLVVLWRQFGRRHLLVLSTLVLLVWALPIGWENTVSGFQQSFYLLVLLFVLALALLPDAAPASARWYLGAALLVLSLFTLGSGPANAVAVGAALALGWLAAPSRRRDIAPGLIACVAIVLLGVALATPSRLPGGVRLQPMLQGLGLWMAWPTRLEGAAAVLPWLPTIVLAAVVLRRPSDSRSIDRTLLAVGVWVGLQAVAVAYGRVQAESIAARYMDLLALGFVVNGAAILALAPRAGGLRAGRLAAIALAAWSAMTVPGLIRIANDARTTSLPMVGSWYYNHRGNLRRFLQTGDIAVLAGRSAPLEIPHPNASLLAGILTVDGLRQYLPPGLQPPLDVEASAEATPGVFTSPGTSPSTSRDGTRPSWGSYGDGGGAPVGRFVSAPLACSRAGYVRIDLAGLPGGGATSLRLVDAHGGTIVGLDAGDVDPDRWTPVIVQCPPAAFTIVAEDASTDGWLAFRHPVEYGPLSGLAFRLARAWRWVLACAVLAALAAIALSGSRRRD